MKYLHEYTDIAICLGYLWQENTGWYVRTKNVTYRINIFFFEVGVIHVGHFTIIKHCVNIFT